MILCVSALYSADVLINDDNVRASSSIQQVDWLMNHMYLTFYPTSGLLTMIM